MGTTEDTEFHSVFYGEKAEDRGGRTRREQHLHGSYGMLARLASGTSVARERYKCGSRAVQVFHNRHLCLSPSDQIFIKVNDSIAKFLQSHIVKTYLYPFDIQDFSQFFISVPAISDKNGHCFYIHNTEKTNDYYIVYKIKT